MTLQRVIPKTKKIDGVISTDEETELPVEVTFEYAPLAILFEPGFYAVSGVEFELFGKTETPKEIIMEQVRDIVRTHFHPTPVDFNY